MSGLFVGHVVCPACGLTGPSAKADPPRFGTIEVELGPEPWDVAALVRSATTSTRQVAEIRFRHEDGNFVRGADRYQRFAYGRIMIVCAPFVDEGREGNEWRLIGRADSPVMDLARTLVAALERLGSRCDEINDRGRRSSFIEWLDDLRA